MGKNEEKMINQLTYTALNACETTMTVATYRFYVCDQVCVSHYNPCGAWCLKVIYGVLKLLLNYTFPICCLGN